MTPEEAFIQAIRAAPADDASRLIYADWLDEHGHPDRAEFIRIQCRTFRLAEEDQRATALCVRAEELLRSHWEEWVGPLRDIVGLWCDRYGEGWLRQDFSRDALGRFPRGFIERLSLDAEDYLRHAHTLRRLTPLGKLLLWGGGRCMARLAQEPSLAGLSALGFTDYYDAPLTARDAAVLASSPYLNGLRMLLLGWNSLGDAGVEALVRAPWLAGLRFLDLSENGLSDRGAIALAESPYLGSLQALLLHKNAFSSTGIGALTRSANLRCLRRLEYDPPTDNGFSVGNDAP
ncbi:MAG TPA: TIGR02996 domain-containing protein [Gemmataceae bacterium]|nr:TIGR02996 domain-containing protein [Gemmataceae bacterium]